MEQLRTTFVVAAFALVAAITAACGSDGEGGAGGASAGPTTVAVTLTEFRIEPSIVHAPAGSDLRFEVTNAGTADHTFGVMAPSGLIVTDTISSGTSATFDVPALDEGTYELLCSIAGHADAGMKGSLMISADGATVASGGDTSGGGMSMSSGMTVQQMLDGHAAGVQAFPATTQGTGNQILDPVIENGWKVFRLTATQVRWETKPGVFVDAMAYNGQIPGPELRVSPGDKVRIVVENQMTEPTVMHFHGLTVPNAMDGVPYITQDPILPGGFFTYEFTIVDPPGMYVYHSHFNSTEQVGRGLYGAIIVVPTDGTWDYPQVTWDTAGNLTIGPAAPIADEFTLFLGDGPLGYVLNAKEFPATAPIVAKLGDWVLIHMANDGSMLHPMHLHGFHFAVVGVDGFPLAQPYMSDTLVVAPGQRFDVLVRADQPGAWAFHCHILPHVEGPEGMYGMVTALVVQ
mgnify:CR=1 FL=1